MKRDDLVRIGHIIDAAEAALRFVNGRKREELAVDEMLRFALVQAVQVVGEAAGKLSAEARLELDDIPGRASSPCAIASCTPTCMSTRTFYGPRWSNTCRGLSCAFAECPVCREVAWSCDNRLRRHRPRYSAHGP